MMMYHFYYCSISSTTTSPSLIPLLFSSPYQEVDAREAEVVQLKASETVEEVTVPPGVPKEVLLWAADTFLKVRWWW